MEKMYGWVPILRRERDQACREKLGGLAESSKEWGKETEEAGVVAVDFFRHCRAPTEGWQFTVATEIALSTGEPRKQVTQAQKELQARRSQ